MLKTDDQSQDPRREELKKALEETKEKGEFLSRFGAEISKLGAETTDRASLGLEAVVYGSPYADWENSIEGIKRLNHHLDDMIGETPKIIHLASGTGISSGTSLYDIQNLVSPKYIKFMPSDVQPEAVRVHQMFENHFAHSQLHTDVERLMRVLGFAKTALGRTAISKFTNAWELYEQKPMTTDPAIGSLMSMRESMDTTINELLRLRPKQGEAKKKWKIVEIGAQLALDGIDQSIFQDLQRQYTDEKELHDQLCDAKEHVISRPDETDLLQKGTLLLKNLLGAIDPNKVRS